jgi:hypothetical protein
MQIKTNSKEQLFEWENNIKMCYAEIRRDGTDRIHMARNRHQKRAVMNTTITAAFDKMRSICRLSDRS